MVFEQDYVCTARDGIKGARAKHNEVLLKVPTDCVYNATFTRTISQGSNNEQMHH